MYVVTVVVSGLIASAVGANGDAWLWTTILGMYPLLVVVHFLTMQLFPPDVEPTGDYRSILYDGDRSRGQTPDKLPNGHDDDT
jgi:hypothetical protein